MEQEKVLKRLVGDLKKLYGEELLSVVLYGSASRGDHAGRFSDLNVLVVLKDLDLGFLERGADVAVRWTRQGNPPMLFFTPALIEESRDVFPMEFLDIRDAHRVLFGGDYFKEIEIAGENLRLQCESELKGKLIQLRERYLLTSGKRKELHRVLVASFSAVMTICRGVLRLCGEASPGQNPEVIRRICERFGLDPEPFRGVAALKRGGSMGGIAEIRETFRSYYRELRKLSSEVDRLGTMSRTSSQGGGV